MPHTTRLYKLLWQFAAKRQEIFRARLTNEYDPSTVDPVLREYKFTNAYRASDRTSQFLIRNVIYDGQERTFRDEFARILLFKLFNRIETWQSLERQLGQLNADSIQPERLSGALKEIKDSGTPLYSAAYIMPHPGGFGFPRKHENHLQLLRLMIDDRVDEKIQEAHKMAGAYEVLLSYPSIGPFLAYQFVIDLNYSDHLDFSEAEFVVAGPGAKDGLRLCFEESSNMDDADLIRWTMDRQGESFEADQLDFQDLWSRSLQLIDCQNLLCEISKYVRAALPGVTVKSGRKRIKQRFNARPERLTAWYPPKWRINSNVEAWQRMRAQWPQQHLLESKYCQHPGSEHLVR